MNICMLSMDFLPNIGGVAAHVHEISQGLKKKGHQVLVANILNTGKGDLKISRDEINGITVYRITGLIRFSIPISIEGALLFLPGYTNKIIANFKNMFGPGIREIAEFLNEICVSQNIQVLHSHTTEDAGLSKFVRDKVPTVFTNHTSGYLTGIEELRTRLWCKAVLNHLDAVIAPSKELAVKSRVFTKKNIYYIPNGVDTSKFKPGSRPRELIGKYGIGNDIPVVLCPRRLVEKNGVEYFIKAVPFVLEETDKVKFIIVGDGPERRNIESLIDKLGISNNVILTGAIANPEMPSFYNLADIVVLPSLIEATSIAGLEAMASGLPLVGSDIGGIPEIIEDRKNGFLVRAKAEKDIADSLIILLKEPDLKLKMGESAREKAINRFDWQNIVDETLRVYEETIAGWKNSA